METKITGLPTEEKGIVYVRPVAVDSLSEDLRAQAGDLITIYSVHRANGMPLALVGDRDLAFALARQHDFAPVSVVTSAPYLLLVNPSVGVNTVADLIALAKSRPGKILYASAGNGTAGIWAWNLSRRWPASTWCIFPTKAARRRSPICSRARCRRRSITCCRRRRT